MICLLEIRTKGVENMKNRKKYKPLVIAFVLTILAFIVGYTSNNMPENVARSYLASTLIQDLPDYQCNQIQLTVTFENHEKFQADYKCKLIAKNRPVQWLSGTIKLKKVPYTWKVLNHRASSQ